MTAGNSYGVVSVKPVVDKDDETRVQAEKDFLYDLFTKVQSGGPDSFRKYLEEHKAIVVLWYASGLDDWQWAQLTKDPKALALKHKLWEGDGDAN